PMSPVQRDVARMLASYSRRTWETWAQARGLDPQKLRGPALQTELARVLLAPAALKAALAATTADEKIVLARLKEEGGKAPAAERSDGGTGRNDRRGGPGSGALVRGETEIREASFATLQRDLYLLLQAVRESPVKLLKSGDVAKRDSERLLKILPTAGAGE